MASLWDIVAFTDEYLKAPEFKDYCPNGLQVEGCVEVNKVVSGVTASQALINGAIERQADIILVHHGFFWRGEESVITGIKKRRIKALLQNDINLLAYHLPLDAHPVVGNNVQLAKHLSLNCVDTFEREGCGIGVIAETSGVVTSKDLAARIRCVLGREPVHLSAASSKEIRKVAICTGGAQSYFEAAIIAGADAYITGEVSESCYHMAMESGIDYFAAGHHATERYGVQALGDSLAEKFNVTHEYLEINNPV